MWHKGLRHCPGCHLDLLFYHPLCLPLCLLHLPIMPQPHSSLSYSLTMSSKAFPIYCSFCLGILFLQLSAQFNPISFFWRLFDQCLLSEKPSETICLNVLSTLAPAFSIPMNCFIFLCNTYHHFPLYYTYLSACSYFVSSQ